jgi:hypothetical protein
MVKMECLCFLLRAQVGASACAAHIPGGQRSSVGVVQWTGYRLKKVFPERPTHADSFSS